MTAPLTSQAIRACPSLRKIILQQAANGAASLSFPALKSEACRFEGQCLKKVVPEEEEESDETDAGSGWITRTTKFCTWR